MAQIKNFYTGVSIFLNHIGDTEIDWKKSNNIEGKFPILGFLQREPRIKLLQQMTFLFHSVWWKTFGATAEYPATIVQDFL